MKAIRFHAYGAADVLRFEEVALPEPADGDVLVEVHSAGVNPADIQFRRGDYQAFAPLPLPFIPGWDLAGTIVAAGPGATRYKPGDAVFGFADMSRNGACAEYIAVRESELARAPASLPPEQAAAVPLAALTAWSALFDHGALRAGQSVLVHAGAGGVGMFAVQLARRAGARVIATASAARHALLHELGAHEVIDYREGDFAAGLREVDLVLDTVGGQTREQSWPVLRAGGLLAAIAMPPPDDDAARRHGVRASMVSVRPDGERLAQIAALFDAGELRVVIDSEFPLAQAQAAHLRCESRRACGKIVLRVAR